MKTRRFVFALGALITVGFACGALANMSQEQDQGIRTTTQGVQDENQGDPEEIKVLFLGDGGHHRPGDRFEQIQPVLAERGIVIEYTRDMADINAENLANYDALLVYANIDNIDPEPAAAIMKYVADGGGFVPLHCASYCFRNSDDLVKLMGAQFRRHGYGTFRTQIDQADHPIMKGFGSFESWDETYVHTLHNEENREVLSYRVDDEGREPWTWVRTHEKGRVFYTAWGHDQRTWGHAGFQNLLERGIRWSVGQDPSVVANYPDEDAASGDNTDGDTADGDDGYQRPFPIPDMTPQRTDVAPFEYVDVGAKIPNYRPGAAWGTQDENHSMMQQPLSPEESAKHIVTPVGFHVELFVSEEDLGGKPICMAWDERGRLWVSETYDYPNELSRDNVGRDRIRICEDTDGDGKADKFHVFAEDLSIPSTITFANGGAIVQNGTETLFLKDTDGDDVADERTVMFTGWNMRDTHGGVSNMRYGLDNWMWAMQGYNNSSPVVNGVRGQRFNQGFFRFKSDGSDLEFLRSTDNNTWGLGLSESGIVFGSTANRNPSVYMPIPNRYYESVRGWRPSLTLRMIADTHRFTPITEAVRQVDQHGGYTAGAGHALYTARKYPQEYWNRVAFVNGPTGHLVGAFIITSDGANYTSRNPFNLFASDDEWTAPIAAEVGPDGNVWILDWYNYIVQHNPTPRGFETGRGAAYESDLRDKKHGRIYRVVYHGEDEDWEPSAASPMSLEGASPEKLVATLAHETMLWRMHAQRLLVERGEQDVLPQLIAMAGDQEVDEVGLNAGVTHALWTIHGLGALGPDSCAEQDVHSAAYDAAVAALRHPSYGVRRAALGVLPRTPEAAREILNAELLMDDHAQVRLAAFLTLAEMPPSTEVARAIVMSANAPINREDRWIPEAITAAAATHAAGFLRAVTELEDAEPELMESVTIVAGHFARTRSETENGTAEIDQLLQSLAEAPSAAVETGALQAILAGIADGWSANVEIAASSEREAILRSLAERMPTASQADLVRLGRRLGSRVLDEYAAEVAGDLLAQVENEDLRTRQRVDAAEQLIRFLPDDAETLDKLIATITPRMLPDVAEGIVRALANASAEQAAESLLAIAPSATPNLRSAMIGVLLQRREWIEQLVNSLEAGELQLGDMSLDQRQQLANTRDRRMRGRITRILERGGALPNADRQVVLDQLASVAEVSGDPEAGFTVFDKNCSKCHMHGGKGADIGPDLTGMAVHPKEHLLAEIIDPNRSLEGNFRTYTVATTRGQILNGLLAAESRTTIELFDVEGKKHTILREEIDEMESTGKSLMPEGFEKQLTEADFADLLAFLTKRGKFLPLDLRRVASIASDRGMFNTTDNTMERLIFSDWGPKEFNGVPFSLIDPQDGRVPNVILLNGPNGQVSAEMPRSVELPLNAPAKAIHMLSGVAGWAFPYDQDESISVTVRLHYADGAEEDHDLRNGVHFADYIRRVDVEGSQFAFALRGQQIRYLAVTPLRNEIIERIELLKGRDRTAPVVMAITVEGPDE